jgi:hypothetical protein
MSRRAPVPGRPTLAVAVAVAVAVVVSVLLGAACRREPAAAGAATFAAVRDDFEDSRASALPDGWSAAQTVGELGATATLARWEIAAAADAASGRNVLRVVEAVNRGPIFNLCLRAQPVAADVVVTTRVHARAGQEDQGGGVVWRAQGPDNYYLARWNPIDAHALGLYKVERAFRVTLATATVAADPATWHTLCVSMRGRRIEVAFDGRPVITWSDATFEAPGRVGLWTKADARSDFDDVQVVPP